MSGKKSTRYEVRNAKTRIARIKTIENLRVRKGGHNIPSEVIIRRYYRGIKNLFDLYIPVCDNWLVIDNMDLIPEIIARSSNNKKGLEVLNEHIWQTLLKQKNEIG